MPGQKPIRIRLAPMLPLRVALMACLGLGTYSVIAAAFKFIPLSEACTHVGLLLAVYLGIHFTPLGWLEFPPDRQRVHFVSVFKRQFWIMGWPVTLDLPEVVQLSPESQFLICREDSPAGLQFSVRTREPDGTESIVRKPWTLTYRDALELSRSIQQQAGVPARLRNRRRDATGYHDEEWRKETDRMHSLLLYLIPAALLPYGGFAVRIMTGNPVALAASGLALLACMEILLWRASNLQANESTNEGRWTLPIVFTLLFALMYTISVFVAAALLARRDSS